MEPETPGAAFFAWSRSRPNLVGAGADVGSRTSDFRSRSRQKKWRLSNTDLYLCCNSKREIYMRKDCPVTVS